MHQAPRYLRFARSLALVSPLVAACGGSSTPVASPPVAPSASNSAGTTTVSTSEPPPSMPTDGPCRCSWDTNAQAAPRVCKRGEINYEGQACVAGGGGDRGEWDRPIKGPLPPPELPRARAKKPGRGRPSRAGERRLARAALVS